MPVARRFVVVVLALVLAACSHGTPAASGPSPSPSASETPGSPAGSITSPPSSSKAGAPKKAPSAGILRFSRVIVVVMENKEYGSIIGSSKAPYINSLASRYSLATQFYAATHPSLPNYLALTGGSTFGITSDCTDCHVNAPNIVTQLEGAGISWKAYNEGLPSPCSNAATSGTYAKKHNPFMYFDDITSNPARCSKVVPMTQLDTDLTSGNLPSFVWVTPDLCHDMHDCSVTEGDHWLSSFLPPLLKSLDSHGVLFLTWDEGSTGAGCCTYASGGHIPAIVAGPAARANTTSATAYDHYSLLRTIEVSWNLGMLGNAACSCSPDMRALVNRA